MSTSTPFAGSGRALAVLAAVTALGPLAVRAEAPMSAIDWLSKSVTRPAVQSALPQRLPPTRDPAAAPPGATTPQATAPGADLPPGTMTRPEAPEAPGLPGTAPGGTPLGAGPGGAAGSAVPGAVAVSVLRKGPALDGVGLLPVQKTGLPRDLWGKTPTKDLVQLIRQENLDTLPALQQLLYTVLLAEVDPPADSTGDGRLLLARLDRLLDLGALDQAEALLQLSGTDRPELFRRWFDVTLLLGDENRACQTMRGSPDVAPTFPARIFCLARSGDWNAAALTLRTAEALGFVTGEQNALLERFLDPEIEDGAPPLPPPSRPSPLVWRMMEAIGEPMPTNTLPVAFAQGDLRSNAGWKQQIEAAERLARTGAVSPNRLLGLYTERHPAASGGVWDRVAAIQSFDNAVTRGNPKAIAHSLPAAWQAMQRAHLEAPFAQLYGARLAGLPLTGPAAAIAYRVGLLSKRYESIATLHKPADATEAFLRGIARGELSGTTPPDAMGRAIAAAFATPAPVPEDLDRLLQDQRLGEAILRAIDRVSTGAQGDLRGVTDGLALLRRVGLEDAARQTALQLMLLHRQG